MILYEADKHELIALKWFLDLRAKPAEFEKLFMKPLRSLTPFLNWAADSV